jgi:epidermal growth factor receptor substrate 15
MATLDQLDAWGTIDSAFLNTYTLEQLDSLVMHEASASDTISISETASAGVIPTVSASSSIAITESASATQIFNVAASDSIAMTTTSTADKFFGVSASDTISMTTTGTNFAYRIPTQFPRQISMNATASFAIFSTISGSGSISMSASNITGEKLGETFADVSGASVVWSVQ